MCSDTVCVLLKHNVCSPTRCVRREGFGPLLALWQCPASESVVVVLVPHSNTRKQFSLRSLEIHQVFSLSTVQKDFLQFVVASGWPGGGEHQLEVAHSKTLWL